MESVYVKEANSEVLVYIGRNVPNKLTALKEAIKILGREVIRYESNSTSDSSL